MPAASRGKTTPTPAERILDEQGRTIAWLARETGVSVTYAWRMLRGERRITADFRRSAAKALGVPEDIAFPERAA